MKKIELFYEPLKVQERFDINCEMTEYQLAFLCGVIRNKKPKRIVEVGVAYGGTTCVIMECLRLLDIDVEMHSIDISKEYYRNPSLKCGEAVSKVFNEIPHNIKHYWHLGYSFPEVIESIGNDIDLIILDTVHSMPGEMLDFIAAFPYLNNGGAVILHDLILNHLSDNEYGYATKVVYDVVVADKIVADGIDNKQLLPSIGAFEINNDTSKYIEKCFSALTITWKYIPDDKIVELYRKLYEKNYEESLVDLFDKSYQLNKISFNRNINNIESCREELVRFQQIVTSGYKVILYGAGKYAEKIAIYLDMIGRKCEAFVVSDSEDIEICKIKRNVYHYSNLPYRQKDCVLIMAVNPGVQQIVLEKIEDNQFHEIFSGEGYVYNNLIQYIDNYKAVNSACK